MRNIDRKFVWFEGLMISFSLYSLIRATIRAEVDMQIVSSVMLGAVLTIAVKYYVQQQRERQRVALQYPQLAVYRVQQKDGFKHSEAHYYQLVTTELRALDGAPTFSLQGEQVTRLKQDGYLSFQRGEQRYFVDAL